MTTIEMAWAIVAELGLDTAAAIVDGRHEQHVNAVYRLLLNHNYRRTEGYGVSDGERGASRRYADERGYFWLPCILCGHWFGGHEHWGESVPLDRHCGIGVCPDLDCVNESRRVHKLFPDGILVRSADRPLLLPRP